jgi:hypothetical protein
MRLPILLLVALVLGAVSPAGAAEIKPQWTGQVPVELYVNVDDMSALWPFRDDETGAVPREGEENYDAYRERWQTLVTSVFEQLRPRVPRHYKIVAARTEELTAPLRIGVWVADMQTSCSAPTYYKYLWVQISQPEPLFASNWDDLGVRSEAIIDMNLPKDRRDRADLESWMELWGQVPYLHVRKALPGELDLDIPVGDTEDSPTPEAAPAEP